MTKRPQRATPKYRIILLKTPEPHPVDDIDFYHNDKCLPIRTV